MGKTGTKVVVVVTSASARRARAVAKWVRALLPAAALVLAAPGFPALRGIEDASPIVVDADRLPGPLSLADALARAAGAMAV